MKPIWLTPLLSLLLLASFNAHAAGSALRIVCDGDADGAEVYINDKFKGECPLDLKVPEGRLKLRVQMTVDADHEPRLFEQEIRMGDGVMKKVEVQLSPLELTAEGKRRQEEETIRLFELGMVAIPGKNYAIGKHEVTQGQWKAIMGNNPSLFRDCGDNCPVEYVSWNEIQEFLTKLNRMTGKQYRLPNEAEWEYACYGGSQTEYCGGNNIDAVAWYENNSGGKSHPVGQKQANGYGLHDMSGNVAEWMENCYDNNCTERMYRCGSWNYSAELSRAADARCWKSPADRAFYNGFRLARTLP
ncbi:formylglycine-generating enzyme family protein [Sideroxyarcus sp. TK5]